MVVVAFEWTWDGEHKSVAAEVSPDAREVRFHINYSSGTAAVCGTHVMADRQYFWEVKMTTPVYGTDMVTALSSERICSYFENDERSSLRQCVKVKKGTGKQSIAVSN